jgi:hypothetical protein
MKRLFAALKVFTDNEREKFLAQITQPTGMITEEFIVQKEHIRNNAFRITVTIFGVDGENRFGNSEQLFEAANLPEIIRGIYMTNLTSYKTIFGCDPKNNFQVNISFDKPALFDWSLVLSAPTPNVSNLIVKSFDMTFANAVVATVMKNVERKKRRVTFLHGPYSYDLGLWNAAGSLLVGSFDVEGPDAGWLCRLEGTNLDLSNSNWHISLQISFSIFEMGISYQCAKKQQ